MTYEEFCQIDRAHVLETCQRELAPDAVSNAVERIYREAYARFQDRSPQYWICWTLASVVEELQTPERRAILDAECEAAMATVDAME